MAGIFEGTNDVFRQPVRIYLVLIRSQLWIPTPGFNQSSWGESGKYSSRVNLSVWLVRGCYGLSVKGLCLFMKFPVLS